MVGRLRIGRRSADGCGGGGRVIGHRDGHSRCRRRHSGRIRLPTDVLGVGQLVVLFPLHPPILEPNFDLALREAEAVSDFDPPPPRQVAIKMKFLFQLEDLVASVGRPLAFGLHSRRETSASVGCALSKRKKKEEADGQTTRRGMKAK